MKLKVFCLSALMLGAIIASAKGQSIEEIKRDTRTYIFGEGEGVTISQAEGYALTAISNQISVTIHNSTVVDDVEQGSGDDIKTESYYNAIVKTYSNATLSNTRKIILSNEPEAHVFMYIKRADIERIFESRKEKILSFVEDAEDALAKCQINDALKHLYWAHALTKSLQYPNELTMYDDEGVQQMVNVWIPSKINDILGSLSFSVSEVTDDQMVVMNITYKDKPVTSLDYTYFDGAGWSNIYGAKDGKGSIELRPDSGLKKVQIKTEYAFEGEAKMDPEIQNVLETIPSAVYKKAYTYVELDGKSQVAAVQSGSKNSKSTKTENFYPELGAVKSIGKYENITSSVLNGITSKQITAPEQYFTPEGLKAYNSLVKYGRARIIDSSSPKYYTFGDKVYCRNILMNFSFRTNNRTFAENVVFEFNEDKKISNVTLGLSQQASDDIFGKTMWPEAARIILTHFLEGYKSAYSLKQIDYVENVFAEDALIITGSYVRTATSTEMAQINSHYVRYTQQSKSEYVKKLKYIFGRNEYININFADCDLIKAGKGGEIYGIQIKQEYNSSSYGDTGYLFLMVDLNNIERPVIHVRTWQPEKDPNFGVYNLTNF